MFTQTKGVLWAPLSFLLTFFFENRVKTKYVQMLKCSNFRAIFIFGPLTIVLQKSIHY